MIVFGLDYDDTYTRDPELWDSFISMAISRGHLVLVVTARPESDPVEHDVTPEVIYCGGAGKRAYCDAAGVPVPDIWIDDMPEII